MTERIHSLPPQIATPTQSVYTSVARTFARDAIPTADAFEEEPYTIKCICDYSDDDGNTIYCETCDTWQHIECFYHGNVEDASRDDFNHFCADCKPRVLDRRKASERQRQQRQDRPIPDTGEKKTKRPPSKSHKKKPKLSDVRVNGYYHDQDAVHITKAGSPIDPHIKKSKSSHRSHHSISSHVPKRSPPHNHRSHSHGHPLSPATTPPDLPDDFHIHSYSKQLQDLYDNDPGPQHLQTNSFASLAVTSAMSLWLRDPDKLRIDAGVEDFRDVFQMVKPEFDLAAHQWPELQANSKEVMANDVMLRLRYLTVVEPLRGKEALVGELKGFVGFQKDYYNEEPDRFTKLCHPAPFVFFHPRLPLYIDTRREGSQCRYIRRSCRANTTLDTYITNQSEYHFCIMNERPLVSGEQVTLAWDFRFKTEIKARYLYLLGLSDEDGVGEPDVSDLEYVELTELIDNVLSDYGGCACGLGSDCAFARFHRNYLGRSHTQSNGMRLKKGRRTKQHISPTSTGQATNSRDVSEGRQEPYDGEDDSRSTTGSTQGKPRSRDLTPFRYGPNETIRASDEHVSEREKRKLMDIEKTFEKMDQVQPPRKKKRMSDGPPVPLNTVIPTAGPLKTKQKSVRSSISNTTSTLVNGSTAMHCKGASIVRQHSHSPPNDQLPTVATPSPSRPPSRQGSVALRSNYKDSSTQTEDANGDWYCNSSLLTPKKTYIPLSRRLLNSQHKLRARREADSVDRGSDIMIAVEAGPASHTSSPEQNESYLKWMGPGHAHPTTEVAERPKSRRSSIASVQSTTASTDVPMLDAPPSIATIISKPTPPPWPGTFAPPSDAISSVEQRSATLRVEMPPVPSLFNNSHQTMQVTSTSSITTPPAAGSTVQSPLGANSFPTTFSPSVLNSVGQHSSPVKKKLSLKDYRARMASAGKVSLSHDTDATPALLSSLSLTDETKMSGIVEGSAIVESPVSERKDDPLATAGDPSKDIPEALNGIV